MILPIVVLYHTSTLVSSKPLGNAPNIVKTISENLTVIKNVSWDFFKVFRSNNTNNSNDKNLQWSPSNGQERLKREVSSQNDIPCQHRMQEITLFKDSYEIIFKDTDNLILSKTPKVLNITCFHQNQYCCKKKAIYCRTFSRNRKFIRISDNKSIIHRSLKEISLGEYCKYTL